MFNEGLEVIDLFDVFDVWDGLFFEWGFFDNLFIEFFKFYIEVGIGVLGWDDVVNG